MIIYTARSQAAPPRSGPAVGARHRARGGEIGAGRHAPCGSSAGPRGPTRRASRPTRSHVSASERATWRPRSAPTHRGRGARCQLGGRGCALEWRPSGNHATCGWCDSPQVHAGLLARNDSRVWHQPNATHALGFVPGRCQSNSEGDAFWHELLLCVIPVIGSIARGIQRLNCFMRGSMEPRIEQFSR